MRAVVCETYGSEPVIGDISEPEPGPGQVVVRQLHSSIGAGDRLMAAGLPRMFRPVFSAMLRPPILGRDVAGEVVGLGPGVEGVQVGDRIVGEAGQAWAERVVVPTASLAVVPQGVDLRLASVLPVSGVTALQGLRSAGVREGTRVLVVGASGAVGHLAVQLAVHVGARVTGVCSEANADFVASLGAERVIDYTRERFADDEGAWDVVLDLAGAEPLGAGLACLAPGGRWVSSAGTDGGPWLGPLPRIVSTALRSLVDGRVSVLTTSPTTSDLQELLAGLEEGWLRPRVRLRPLADVPSEVISGTGVAGKVVLDL